MSLDGHTPEAARLKVAVLENDRFAREGIIAELESDGIEVVGTASDATSIEKLVAAHQPDVVIIDLKLDREDREYRGLDVIRMIKEAAPATKCVIVTAFPTVANFRASIWAGAEGFVAKENSVENELMMGEIVRRVVKGERCYDGELVAQIVMASKDQPGVHTQNPLTEREREILRLVDHTNEQIAEMLNVAESTVKAHLKSSFEKLALVTGRKIYHRREAAELAHALGYL
jgi:DNA-binding NarL/FixJ family response regulator